jgi:hypothetical protein
VGLFRVLRSVHGLETGPETLDVPRENARPSLFPRIKKMPMASAALPQNQPNLPSESPIEIRAPGGDNFRRG